MPKPKGNPGPKKRVAALSMLAPDYTHSGSEAVDTDAWRLPVQPPPQPAAPTRPQMVYPNQTYRKPPEEPRPWIATPIPGWVAPHKRVPPATVPPVLPSNVPRPWPALPPSQEQPERGHKSTAKHKAPVGAKSPSKKVEEAPHAAVHLPVQGVQANTPAQARGQAQTQVQTRAQTLDQTRTPSPPASDQDAMRRYLVKNHETILSDTRRHQEEQSARANVHVCSEDGWDIVVQSRAIHWRLHRRVLAQCDFFARLLPHVDPIDNALKLHGHVPEQLACVFHFLYRRDYPGADFDVQDPLIADCVLRNTAVYLAGASVGYLDLMKHAERKIRLWSNAVLAGPPYDGDGGGDGDSGDSHDSHESGHEAGHVTRRPYGLLQRAVQLHHGRTMDYVLLRLASPLQRALVLVYQQPPAVRDGLFMPLRLTLLEFLDLALPYLATNESFRAHYRNTWTRPLPVLAMDGDAYHGGTYHGDGDGGSDGDSDEAGHHHDHDHDDAGEAGSDKAADKAAEGDAKTSNATQRRPHDTPSLADAVQADHATFQALGMLRSPADKTRHDFPPIADIFGMLNRLASIEQWGRSEPGRSPTPATDADERFDMDESKDATDGDREGGDDDPEWHARMGQRLCEREQAMGQLMHALRGVFVE